MWSPSRPFPLVRRPTFALRLSPDLLALLAAAVASSWDVLRPGDTTVGLDAVSFFYPMFSFMGERLRDGHLPGWNPYQFAGVPFAADPESGWMYLPAMLAFALFPLAAAAKVFALVHLLLAGLGTYALARVLRITPAGALTAAVAFECGSFFSDRLRCCFAHVQLTAWLPLLLLGLELSLRTPRWSSRLGWWSVSGFALSQILAGWLGQGAYYVLLTLGAYALYRCVIDPPHAQTPLTTRLVALPLHLGPVLLIGFVLAAAGILPRLEYNARSNLAAGYGGNANLAWAADLGAWPWRHTAELMAGRTGWYAGGAVAALAILAPFIARRRHATPFFATLVVAGLLLVSERATPLHTLLYTLLPRFADLHRHRPERVLDVWYLAVALLAGATVGALPSWRPRLLPLLLVAGLPVALGGWLALRHIPIAAPTWAALLAACLGLVAYVLLPPSASRFLPPLFALIVAVDLIAGARVNVARGLFATVDLTTYDRPTGAAAFLRSRSGEPPFRFFGYDPAIAFDDHGQTVLYRLAYRDPRTADLLVNNRGTLLRLPDLQGYNPVQPQRYVDLIAALNGQSQEYHGSYVFPAGLDSPLLNLLNARYIVLPATIPPDRADLTRLVATHPTVYHDATVRVVANPDALPRAWIVHEARQVPTGQALPLLTSRAVDPRQTALLETPPPPLAPPRDPAADRADVLASDPDRLLLQTRTDAPGLLVLSETYDPAWHAQIDGHPAPLVVADHDLRAIPIPPGDHTVELRYESSALRLGLAITLAGSAALALLLIAAWWRRRRELPRLSAAIPPPLHDPDHP